MKRNPVNIDRLIKIISAISLVIAGVNIYFWLDDRQYDLAKGRRCDPTASLYKAVPFNPATDRLVVGFERGVGNGGGGLCAG